MIPSLCALALAQDLPLPAPSSAPGWRGRTHAAIVVTKTGEFAVGAGLLTGLAGFGLVEGTPGCDLNGTDCSASVFGVAAMGAGVAGVVLGLPCLVVGVALRGTSESRRSARAELTFGPGRLVVSGTF